LRHATSSRPLKQAGIYVTEDFSSKKTVGKAGNRAQGSPTKINPLTGGGQQVLDECSGAINVGGSKDNLEKGRT
jgi:hypothetical protein